MPLGASLGGLLGASWGPKTIKNGDANTSPFLEPKPLQATTVLGPQEGHQEAPKGAQKGLQKGPQIEPITDQNRSQFLTWKKALFKTVLEASWSQLGAFWAPSWGPKKQKSIGKRYIP